MSGLRPASEPPIVRLVRSVGFKIAALHAVLLVLSSAALGAFFWWNTAGYLDRQVDRSLQADVALLTERHAAGGIAAVAAAIRQRIDDDLDNEALYLLEDAAGAVRVRNIDAWPAGLARDGRWLEGPVQRDGAETVARLVVLELDDGGLLLIGRDVAGRIRLRALVADAVLYGSVLALVLAALGGGLVQRVLERRIAPVAATAAAIGHGDLAHRVRLSGTDDEFDQLAETFNSMLDRIGVLMDGVRQVSNAIAHDLRTPIARTRARLEEVLRGAADAQELRAGVERGIVELDGIIAMFQAILRISEIEAGARRSAFAPFDLAATMEDAASLYEALAEEKGVRFAASLPGRLEMVGDRDLVLQALANLLDNAIKFTPAGGEVRFGAEAQGEWLEVTVSDTGPGIPEAERARVTERFYRSETSRGAPGSGLGLTLVEAVAHLHGGSLGFAAGPDGSGLRATLRLARGEVPRRSRAGGAEPAQREPRAAAPAAAA
ncbi:MAG: ATP-binding protein [Acetobacteraceae bacterium]